MIYNSNITKSNQAKKPHQLFKLPQDNITKASGPKSTKEEYETFLKKIEEKEKKSKLNNSYICCKYLLWLSVIL